MSEEENKKSNIAIKYRLYPTQEQITFFCKTFGCCRKVWNLMLSDKLDSYKKTGKFGEFSPAMYKDEYSYLKEVDSLALANVYTNQKRAFKAHFDKKRKKNTGFPKFKSKKNSKKSYTTFNQNGTIALGKKCIKLPKIGWIKAELHRLPEEGWKLKSATISESADGNFYASVLFEYESDIPEIKIDENKIIGIDYKSNGLYMDSNGKIGSNHQYYSESEKKLGKMQRALSKKKAGSKRYEKQKKEIAKLHRHIANQRQDNLQKLSTQIAKEYDAVCVETLNMSQIAKRKKDMKLGKYTLDNGYGMFLNMLNYKLAARGKMLIKVDKWYPSSKTCSCCGGKYNIKLNERTYICPTCRLVIDRDLNAAINIKAEGIRLLRSQGFLSVS